MSDRLILPDSLKPPSAPVRALARTALFGLAFSLCVLAQWLWLSPLVDGNLLWGIETTLAALAASAVGGLWWGVVARSESELSERLLSATLSIGALIFLLLANLAQGAGPLGGLALLGPRAVAALAVLGFFMWGSAPTFLPYLAFPGERGAGRGLFTVYAAGLLAAAAGLLGAASLARHFHLMQSWIADAASLTALGLALWIWLTRRKPRRGAPDPLEDISEITHSATRLGPASGEDGTDLAGGDGGDAPCPDPACTEARDFPDPAEGGARDFPDPADGGSLVLPDSATGDAQDFQAPAYGGALDFPDSADGGTQNFTDMSDPAQAFPGTGDFGALTGPDPADGGTDPAAAPPVPETRETEAAREAKPSPWPFLAKAMVPANDAAQDEARARQTSAGPPDPMREALSAALSDDLPPSGPDDRNGTSSAARDGQAAPEGSGAGEGQADSGDSGAEEDTLDSESDGEAGPGCGGSPEESPIPPRYPWTADGLSEGVGGEAEETPLRFWPARSLGYFTFESGRGHELLVYDRACQTLKPASFLGAAAAAGAAAVAALTGLPAAGDFPAPWGAAFLIPLGLSLGAALLGPALARAASPMTALGLCLIMLSLFMSFGPREGGAPEAWLRLMVPLAILGALWPLSGRVTAGRKGFFPLSLASMNVWILSGATAGIGAFLTLAAVRPGESCEGASGYVALAAAFLAAGPSLSWLFTGVMAVALGLLYYFL
ncbi:MAG: hypothetical protein LBT40_12655 [Deltaproteobacteria bacterium]|jgi:hypothetical protein|nr:hypothetical protein [Deltaproteobacteria bacterium]